MKPIHAIRRLAEIVLEQTQDEFPGGSSAEDELQELLKRLEDDNEDDDESN